MELESNILVNSDNAEDFINHVDVLDRSQDKCNDLLSDWSQIQLTETFTTKNEIFQDSWKKVLNGKGAVEGFTSYSKEKLLTIHHIAKHPKIKTVCETGFNYGHSSFNFLSSNPGIKVYSFDLGLHPYVKQMNQTLSELFPGRLKLTLGSSDKTVPKAIKSGVLPLCDLILVDGGHTYSVAKSDIVYFASHASPESIVLFDDYPTNWGKEFGKAWEESILPNKLEHNERLDVQKIRIELRENLAGSRIDPENKLDLAKTFKIKELMRCKFKEAGFQRGFVVGVSIKI